MRANSTIRPLNNQLPHATQNNRYAGLANQLQNPKGIKVVRRPSKSPMPQQSLQNQNVRTGQRLSQNREYTNVKELVTVTKKPDFMISKSKGLYNKREGASLYNKPQIVGNTPHFGKVTAPKNLMAPTVSIAPKKDLPKQRTKLTKEEIKVTQQKKTGMETDIRKEIEQNFNGMRREDLSAKLEIHREPIPQLKSQKQEPVKAEQLVFKPTVLVDSAKSRKDNRGEQGTVPESKNVPADDFLWKQREARASQAHSRANQPG